MTARTEPNPLDRTMQTPVQNRPSAQARGSDERGFALIMTVLAVLIVGSLVAAATILSSNHLLINNYYERESQLSLIADAGVDLARAALNGVDSIYPDSGYTILQNGTAVTDASGTTIPGVRRWIYAGPSGVTSGQYGVFGSIIAVVEDQGGARVIRRSQVYQESFSKYAYFTDIEPSSIWFGGGDQIFGPVHSNSELKLHSTGVTFHGTVRTASTVRNPGNGTFHQGYTEGVPNIPMPSTADLNKLQVQATSGNTAIVGDSNGGSGEATTRLEFIAIDLNGDGDTSDDNEGFMRVYQSTNADWVTATGNEEASDQCGAYYSGTFVTTNNHPHGGNDAQAALKTATSRCYLGGHDSIAGSFRATTDGYGSWLTYPGTVSSLVTATGRADANYLFPINRALNPNFKGVIHVTGKVVVSGVIRGRITIAATDDIIIGDDITYVTDPGAGTCVDIAGYFAGDDVIVADNDLNAPAYVAGTGVDDYYTLDDTSDEFIHGTVLALSNFTVQNYNSGSNNDEACEGSAWGRGCLYLTGGIIQAQRGAVGLSSGRGYVKRYSYDQCGATSPPPYFPTTGVFAKGQYYNVDPSGFNIDTYFALITP
ncbi:MAG: hypothetical protein AAF389_17295 [Gemmatimonadota bacterium]